MVSCGSLNGFTGLLDTVTNHGDLVGREGTFWAFWGVVYSKEGVTRYDYPGAPPPELVDMNSAGYAIGHATFGIGEESVSRPFLFIPQGR